MEDWPTGEIDAWTRRIILLITSPPYRSTLPGGRRRAPWPVPPTQAAGHLPISSCVNKLSDRVIPILSRKARCEDDEMGRVKEVLRKLTRAPGVPKARHAAERVVAPYLRADLHSLLLEHRSAAEKLDTIDLHFPAVLNAIASVNGSSRLLARDMRAGDEALRQELLAGDEALRAELRTHVESLASLVDQVETMRAAMMHELRHAQSTEATVGIESKVINDALPSS